ncbi:MAG TPA: hypothetical protein VKG24_10360 [Pseudolabrys sp.]|jgi:hypothetical protein|nr:hypothetical protein [Pseudolabrys sp.]
MTQRRPKKEPVGWMGPSKAKGRGTSLGKGRWRVIDSTGQWIASGFTTRAYALRWIDSFHLMRGGFELNDHDHKWLLAHWYPVRPARPVRLDPEASAPTESGDLSVLLKRLKEVWRPLGTAAINPGSRDP